MSKASENYTNRYPTLHMLWKKKPQKESKNTCSECGSSHSDWPALAFNSPNNYHQLTDQEKEDITQISTDFCLIHYSDQIDRFIRVNLFQKIIDSDEELNYGLWVSLSEESYLDYEENFDNENHQVEYFSWLCSYISEYESTISIPMTVVTQPGNARPIIYPHKDHDHQFVFDYYNGISSHEAQARVNMMMKNVG